MDKRQKIMLGVALMVVLLTFGPRYAGWVAAQVTAEYQETLRERAAEDYKRRHPDIYKN